MKDGWNGLVQRDGYVGLAGVDELDEVFGMDTLVGRM